MLRNQNPTRSAQLVIMACVGMFILMVGSRGDAQVRFPEKNITLIIPQTAGGPTDTLSRIVANYAKKYLGVPLVVMNVPGASSVIGARQALNSAPDGYTILVNHGGFSTCYYTGMADFNYDSFEPICRVANVLEGPATYVGAPWKDLKGLIAHARENPGKVRYGATTGLTSHFAMAAIEKAANIKFLFVPFQGESPRIAALAGKHIDVIAIALHTGTQYVNAGKFVMLGTFAEQRSKLFPNIPTLIEQGLAVIDNIEVRGFFAPKGTPKDRIEFLDSAFKKTLEDPECIEALNKASQIPQYMDSEKYKKFYRELDASIGALAKQLDIKK